MLVIAGTDSSGGAGITRDVRTLTELDTQAMCAVTAVTAQSEHSVMAIHALPAPLVRAQIEAAFATGTIDAIKIGMLATRATVLAVAEALRAHPAIAVVVDPVLESSSGGMLLDKPGRVALRAVLLPRVAVLTPNIPEAAVLLGTAPACSEEQMLSQARALLGFGMGAVLLKGGHAHGPHAVDVLVSAQGTHRLSAPRLNAARRGTGCALATAIAASLGAGLELEAACIVAKDYVSGLLRHPG